MSIEMCVRAGLIWRSGGWPGWPASQPPQTGEVCGSQEQLRPAIEPPHSLT
eukprot:COSAG04_NODE_1770_length_5624_cov_3.175204_5_plen_51_part_00